MKITGQILKENREKKGISLSEVAIATKINVKTLQAMEEGDVGSLPPKTFLRGFVRAYASYLDLDVESVSNNFFEEMGSTKPKASPTLPATGATSAGSGSGAAAGAAGDARATVAPRTKSNPSEAHEAINPRASMAVKIGAVAGILLLIVLIVTIKNKMENYQKETVVEGVPAGLSAVNKDGSPQPPSDAVAPGASPAPSPSSAESPKPTPAPSATPTPTPSPTPSATSTPAAAVVAAPALTPSPTPVATPKATPTPSPTPSPTPKATPTPAPSASPTPKPSATPKPAGRPQEVIIESLDAVDVDAQIDDEPLKKFRLKGDQVQSIKAKRRVILKFSDGGAVNLIVNGNERGVPGDLGKPTRIEIP